MRLLHAGNDLGGPRTAARQFRSERRRNTRRHQRQSLHVHGLRQYRARGTRRRRKVQMNNFTAENAKYAEFFLHKELSTPCTQRLRGELMVLFVVSKV